MLNILGGAQKDSHLRVRQAALSIPGRRIHVYGKGDARPGRKMGHITILGTTMDEAERRIKPLIELVDNLRSEREQPFPVLSQRILSFKTVQQSTMRSVDGADTPLVAVTMGSDSDLPVLVPGLRLLEDLGVSFTTRITSAHRTPDAMSQFAKAAGSHGIKVIIAAAGGAAHLPGMIAANTWLPVIGVPVKGSSLDGVDSLHSIVQMPVSRTISSERDARGDRAKALTICRKDVQLPLLVSTIQSTPPNLRRGYWLLLTLTFEVGWKRTWKIKQSQ